MSSSVLGCLGAALSMTLPWPQVWRSVARRRTTGLSASACWLGVAMPIGWITYGLLIGDRWQVLTNCVTGGAGVSVLVALLMSQGELRRGRKLMISAAGAAGVVTAAVLSAASAALPSLDGPHVARVLGLVLAATAIIGAVPQPMSLLRDKTQDLSGLSPLRWKLAVAATSAWFLYGLTTGQPAVWLSALAGLTAAVIVNTVLARAARPAGTDVVQVTPSRDLPTMVMPRLMAA